MDRFGWSEKNIHRLKVTLVLLLVGVVALLWIGIPIDLFGRMKGKHQLLYIVDGELLRLVNTSGKKLKEYDLEGDIGIIYPLDSDAYASVVMENGKNWLFQANPTDMSLITPLNDEGKVLLVEKLPLVNSGGEKYMLINTGNKNNNESTFNFIELKRGKIVDNSLSLTSTSPFIVGKFSPNNDYFVYTRVYIRHTFEPLTVVKLVKTSDKGRPLRNVNFLGFSKNGNQILYDTKMDGKIIIENLDGSGKKVLFETENIQHGILLPGNEEIVVISEGDNGEGIVSLFTIDDNISREIIRIPLDEISIEMINGGRIFSSNISPNGIFIRVSNHLINLSNGDYQTLSELDGYSPLLMEDGLRWRIYYNGNRGENILRALDMDSGILGDIDIPQITIHTPSIFILGMPHSENGRFSLITAYEDLDLSQLWLVDAETGEGRLLAEGVNVEGDITLDGAWVTYSLEVCEEICRQMIYIYEVSTREITEVGHGRNPVWVQR